MKAYVAENYKKGLLFCCRNAADVSEYLGDEYAGPYSYMGARAYIAVSSIVGLQAMVAYQETFSPARTDTVLVEENKAKEERKKRVFSE